MRYFIPGVTAEKKVILQENRIEFVDFTFGSRPGILVAGGYVDDALYRVMFRIDNRQRRMITTVAGAEEITVLEGEFEGERVLFDGIYEHDRPAWRTAVKDILMPVVKKNVNVRERNANYFALKDVSSTTFEILIFSTPDGRATREVDIPEKIWGYRIEDTHCAFRSSNMGETICDDQGFEVAELIGDALYIHCGLYTRDSRNGLKVFEILLKKVAAILRLTAEERLEARKKRAEERRSENRAAYVKQCGARFEKLVESTKKGIKDGDEKIKRLQKELVVAIRELQGLHRKLEQLASANGQLEAFGAEFDKLSSIPKVKFVEADNGVVRVFTDTLYCVDPRTKSRHEIGAFRIDINVGGNDNCVRWFNLTRRVNAYERGMNAPHVFAAGNACFGNTAETFAELVADYEFAAAAMVAIQFVESVNVTDSAGQHVNLWPLAPAVRTEPAAA